MVEPADRSPEEVEPTADPEPLNPDPLNPDPLSPDPLSPDPLSPEPQGPQPIQLALAAPVPTSDDAGETPGESLEAPEVAVDPVQTPPNPDALPEPDAEGSFDLRSPDCFLNRELTWLNFNFRVLHEAEDLRNPLLERVKFMAIVASNLDEFFMKRIGGLKQQVGAGLRKRTVDGRTPQEQIDTCLEVVARIERRMRELLVEAARELREHDIVLQAWDRLSDADRASLRAYYLENIFPLVTPQATDPAHPFPFISNLSLNLLVGLHHPEETVPLLARVKVPVGSGIPRLLKVGKNNTFVTLESVMANNLDLLFPDMEIASCELFRVTRNASTERDEENADDLLAMIESELRDRKFAPIVRMEVAQDMDPHHRGMLAAELGLDENTDVTLRDGPMALRDLMEIAELPHAELHERPHHPLDHPAFQDDRNVFHTIREQGPFLLQHPYESYATSVERFLSEASTDPKVRAIKMIVYRTSTESKAIRHLIDAARNGKQVTVVIELKARFDEQANIGWANRLEEAGVHVTYGVVGLKTHGKVVLVVRQDYEGLRRYAHVGTGNYHAGTARLYSDLGLLTCDKKVGRDLTELFNYLTTGYKPKRDYDKILVAPKSCKQSLVEKIGREIIAHSQETPGRIQFKLNALEDPTVIRALYQASQAGVKVELIVRDSCCLRPGIPGLSDNASVVSIVGRFLEHTRIYYFHNGGDEEYYIGSADCMTRNLDSRVEVLVPVEAPNLREELRFMLDAQLADQRGAWVMQPNGSYTQRQPPPGKKGKGSQRILTERAEKRLRESTRLKRRKPRGLRG